MIKNSKYNIDEWSYLGNIIKAVEFMKNLLNKYRVVEELFDNGSLYYRIDQKYRILFFTLWDKPKDFSNYYFKTQEEALSAITDRVNSKILDKFRIVKEDYLNGMVQYVVQTNRTFFGLIKLNYWKNCYIYYYDGSKSVASFKTLQNAKNYCGLISNPKIKEEIIKKF